MEEVVGSILTRSTNSLSNLLVRTRARPTCRWRWRTRTSVSGCSRCSHGTAVAVMIVVGGLLFRRVHYVVVALVRRGAVFPKVVPLCRGLKLGLRQVRVPVGCHRIARHIVFVSQIALLIDRGIQEVLT